MAHGNSRRREGMGMLVVFVFVTGVAGLAMHGRFESRKVQAKARHILQMEENPRQWARQDAVRKMAVHEEVLQRDQRHLREWELAAGGPARALAKNPDLSLGEMLQQAAEVCAPSGTLVTVRVDRFTDFMVNLEFPQPVLAPQMAEAAACLLQVGAPYLHSLRFFHQGRFLAELDRRGIETIPDWSTVSAAMVEPMLLRPETEAETPPAAAGSLTEETEPVGDFKRLRDAERALAAVQARQMEQMMALLKAQGDAVNLKMEKTRDGMTTKIQQLRQAGAGMAALRDGFLGRESLHKNLLTEQNLDPLAVRILMRGPAGRYLAQREHVTRFFDALAARQSAADYFLNEMRQQWGSWSVLSEAGQISFTTLAAKEAHDRGSAKWAENDAATVEALDAWMAWNQTQGETK